MIFLKNKISNIIIYLPDHFTPTSFTMSIRSPDKNILKRVFYDADTNTVGVAGVFARSASGPCVFQRWWFQYLSDDEVREYLRLRDLHGNVEDLRVTLDPTEKTAKAVSALRNQNSGISEDVPAT